MKIEYTYREPEDKPIMGTTFVSTGAGDCQILVGTDEVELSFTDSLRTFSAADWHDFAVLVARIDRQLGGGK
jgi:formyltetrahydrofolate synthetase